MKLMNNLKAIKKNVKRYVKRPFFRARFYFTHYYKSIEIDDNVAMFESYNNSNFTGNVYYILLEMTKYPELKKIKKYISCSTSSDQKAISNFLSHKGVDNFEVIVVHTKKYCKVLSEAKYLFNNATFPSYFIKKEGQIYLNTWHGTPLKTLGRSIASAPNEIGNSQRNFFMADYLLYPNYFTFQHMRDDYMLDNFYKGQYLIGGYPRNYVFYNKERISDIRKELNIENKEIICYMPTWRGTLDKKVVKELTIATQYYLYEMNKSLCEDKIMYVKLHNFVSSTIDFDDYEYIFPFPNEYETYEFLSISDCLITDYSSVFFDYANLGKKIILFAYDKDEYLHDRGMYLEIDDLPFPVVETLGELHKELENLSKFKDYHKFVETYCAYDNQNYAKKIIDLVFFEKKDNLELIDGNKYANNKKNVLIFGGSLAKNGLTTSLRGLLNHVDTDKYNFTVLFYRNRVKQNNYVISNFPKEISYISIQGQKNISIREAITQFVFMRLNKQSSRIEEILKIVYKRELRRIFGNNLHFDYAIHFTGYEKQIANLFNELDNCKKIIYVHNDMRKEKETRSNYHIPSIMKAYRTFDTIVGIRESMIPEIIELMPDINPNKIKIVHNVNNINHILSESKKPIKWDDETISTHSVEEVESILKNKSVKKYINVARFSPEKGIKRLIEAFEKFNCNYPNAYLIVIGGHGVEYDDIYEHVTSNKLNHVVIIKALSNPFPILKQSDVFIMSSLYEGLPMSIMEALILGKSVVCTNITGPKEFLEKGYGYLVDDSVAGIYKGFEDSYEKDLNLKKFDAEEFNQLALQEFYDILN